MPTVIFAILAGLAFLLLLARTRQDPRRFGNAVLLGLSLVLLTLALLAQVAAGSAPAPLLAAVTLAFVLLALGVLALAFFLIANGVTMVRKEGRRHANLLSGLAGLAVLGCVTLTVTAAEAPRDQSEQFDHERDETAPEQNPDGETWVPGNAPSLAARWSVQMAAKAGTIGTVGGGLSAAGAALPARDAEGHLRPAGLAPVTVPSRPASVSTRMLDDDSPSRAPCESDVTLRAPDGSHPRPRVRSASALDRVRSGGWPLARSQARCRWPGRRCRRGERPGRRSALRRRHLVPPRRCGSTARCGHCDSDGVSSHLWLRRSALASDAGVRF
jgi:hypothetical protein